MSAHYKTAFARRAEFYDRIVSDSGLSRAAIAVAWRLVNHINDETGECFPSVERLAAHLDINERTVRRGVDQLIAAGWFTKTRRGRGGTRYYANYDETRAGMSAFSGEENRAGMSALTTEKNRARMSGKDGKNRTGVSALTTETNRAGVSGIATKKNRTKLTGKPGNPVQRNRTVLPGEPKGEPLQEPRVPPPRVPPLGEDVATAVRLWNDLAERIGHPKVQVVSKTRHRSLGKRLAECGGLDGWRVALAKVEASAFLRGANDRGWRADFDFMVQAKSFTRLMEGCYDDNGPRDGGGGRAGSQGDRKHSFLAGMFGADNGRRP
jgi:hypothetical protein